METQLNIFFLKKITSSYSHVLILIININMMKQLCTRTIERRKRAKDKHFNRRAHYRELGMEEGEGIIYPKGLHKVLAIDTENRTYIDREVHRSQVLSDRKRILHIFVSPPLLEYSCLFSLLGCRNQAGMVELEFSTPESMMGSQEGLHEEVHG